MMNTESESVATFLAGNETFAVLTGAGVSTASGIPDYRDPNGDWKHARPMQYGEFVASESARVRYWARSYAGWRRIVEARPNGAHDALARLEALGKIETLITQNVDGLHQAAGSRRVIDLHGNLAAVRCLDCAATTGRHAWQEQLAAANPGWHGRRAAWAPDGDAKLPAADLADFSVPGCPCCGGVVKPDVVFFGEAVPKARVQEAADAVDRADALLIVGSSLMLFSGFRFARRARERGKPIAILNRGRTRADELAAIKVDSDCATVLPRAVAMLTS